MTRVLNVRIIKKPDDPLCPRVSLGGTANIGFYVTYRGTKEQALELLENAIAGMTAMAEGLRRDGREEPEVSPDDGKKYA